MKPIIGNRAVINIAAATEGAVLIVYASYSRVLINKHYFGLTTDQYGLVFLPELVTIITTAALAARITRRIPTKRVCQLGLGCSLVSMVLLFTSAAAAIHVADYPVLLASSAFLGAGFGMAIPALITYAVILARRPDRSVLAVNALLAVGVILPPILALAFTAVAFWWGPALLTAVLTLLIGASRRLPATRTTDAAMLPVVPRPPARAKLYDLLVIVFSLCAVMCVAWSQPKASGSAQSYLTFRALVLGAFWAALVMLARVLFAALDQTMAAGLASAAIFGGTAGVAVSTVIAHDYALARIGIWVLAALACAALLPLRSRAGTEDLTTHSIVLAGCIAILYPLGLGIARASFTTVRQDGISPLTLFGIVVIVGAAASLPLLRVLSPLRSDRPLAGGSR
jgi:MFS family permease